MKRKLLLTAVALLCAVGMWSQGTWNAPEIPGSDISSTNSGSYAIYNVQADAFLGRGMDWGTKAVACRLESGYSSALATRQKFTLTVNGSTVKMVHASHTGKGVGSSSSSAKDIWVDNDGTGDNKNVWTFASSATTPDYGNVYTLSNDYGVLDVIDKWGGALTTTGGANKQDWAFIPESSLTDGSFAKWVERRAMYDVYLSLVASSSVSTYSSALSTANEVYINASSTVSDLRAATRALIKAVASGIKQETTAISLFTNADIQSANSYTDWHASQNNYITISAGVAENHNANTAISLSQSKTDVPNGFYNLIFHGMYRTGSGDAPYFRAVSGDNTSNVNLPLMSEIASTWGVWNGNQNSYNWTGTGGSQIPDRAWTAAEGLAYEAASAKIDNFKVTGNSLTLSATVTSTAQWVPFQGFEIFYLGNTVSNYSPELFTSNRSATADKWYEFSVGSAGWYRINSSAEATLYYTQNNSDDADDTASKEFTAGGYTFMNLTAGSFYFKTDANSTIKIEAISSSVLQNGDVVTDVFITNPSFEDSDMSSWDLGANSYFGRLSGSNLVGKDGDYYAGTESYLKLNRSISQNLTGIPSGNYILRVRAKAKNYNATSVNASVGMGGNSTPVLFDVEDDYTVAYNAAADDASATIRFGGQFLDGNYGYFYCDNFTLTYYSTLPDVSITSLTSSAMAADVRAALKNAKEAYDGSKTVANYNALQTAIVNAKMSIADFAGRTGEDADWTDVISNPSFETSNLNGWTNVDMGAQSNDAINPYKNGSYYAERWHNAGNKSVKQSLILPAGTYKLTAAAHASSDVTSPQLYAGSCAVAVGEKDNYDVYFKSDGTEAVEIGFRATCTSNSWIAVDNFQLTYNPTLPASLTAVDGKMKATVASTQTTAVSAYNATSGQTIDNLITAQAAMLAAYESKLVYNEIATIKNNYDAKAKSLNTLGQAAYTTATTVASTGAETKYIEGTYDAASEAETAYNRDFITAVKSQGDNSDMTALITNPSFETADKTGWNINYGGASSYESKDIISGALAEGGGSYYYKSWRNTSAGGYVSQTINLPVGHYRLSAVLCGHEGENAVLYVKAGDTEKTEGITTSWAASRISVDFDMAEAGNIVIYGGCRNSDEYHIDDFRLTYFDSNVYANRETIIDNNGDITTLINGTFQDNTDGWSGGSHVTWVTRRGWRGDDASKYYERSSTGPLSYTLSNMPAGTYKVVAAARGYDGGTITPQIAGTSGDALACIGDTRNAKSSSEINMKGVDMPYSKLGGYTSDDNGHNWRWISATGTLASAGDLVVNFNCTGSEWMAIDDVHLYCTELDGTSYTYTVDDDHLDAGDKVVTADIILSNPNAVITSDAAINGAAGAINNNLVDGTIANMVLYDGNSYTSPDDAYAITAATYYRNIAADAKATLMLPFALDATSKAKGTAYAPTRFANDNVSFSTVADPSADVPYVFVPSGDAVTTLTGSRSSAEEGTKQVEGTNVTLYGTYASTTITPNANNYIASQGMLWLVDNTQNSNPFRAYLNVTTPSPVKALTFSFDNETAVSTVEAETGKATIYNLAGQRVNKAQKGLYIVNGKKTYIK